MRPADIRASVRKRRTMWQRRRAAILHVDLDRGLEPLAVPDGYPSVMVIVHLGGAVIGHVMLPLRPVIGVDELWQAITFRHGDVIWSQRLRKTLARAAAVSEPPTPAPDPTVSVIVCTRDRPDRLAR